MKTATSLFNHQQGSTLIEIMVSMFILALGLMALLAMQTRTSAAIKEAENQTIIAQATENLAEQMMTQPVLSLVNGKTVRDYTSYNGNIDCGSKPSAAGATTGKVGAFKNDHLALFADAVCGINGVDTVTANVVNGDTLTVTWTTTGSGSSSSSKNYSYDYPLDNN